MNGKYGISASLRHQPDITSIPFFLAALRNSRESLVLPLPASPETKTVLPFPSKAKLKNASNASSSRSLPTRTGSHKIPHLDIHGQPGVPFANAGIIDRKSVVEGKSVDLGGR